MMRSLMIAALVAATGMLASCAPTPGMSPADMRPHFWKERVVLVFAPGEGDTRLTQQRAALAADPRGMADRKVVTYEVVGNNAVSRGTERLDSKAVPEFRKRFNVPVDDFEVIVIGLDGLVKQRGEEVVGDDELFALIDSMPMRQAEMKAPPATRP